MKRSAVFLLCTFFLVQCTENELDPNGEYSGYTLVWNDEFDSNISSSNWTYELGDGTAYGLPPGWGNSERQLYTSSGNNVLVQPDGEGNSVLAIVARKEPGDNRYSSAKITTKNLLEVRFGRVEARIKVPEGKGIWPAFWMLGTNIDEIDWSGCGEIDIMEVIGSEPNVVHTTVHYTSSENKAKNNGTGFDAGVNLADDYHEYRIDWDDQFITFFLDGVSVHEVPIESDMKEFLRSFYLILNVAVGGNWPGDPDETTVFPKTMLVDWVRVYSQNDLNPPPPPELNIAEETIGMVSTYLPSLAFGSNMTLFDNLSLKSFGGGGEPNFDTSANAIEGDSSLVLVYPGGSWGGAFFIQEPTVDASQYANGHLKFSIIPPAELANAEVKLESVATAYSVFLTDYSAVDVGGGFVEYSIPLSDFIGLDLTDLKIPFALWNPVNANAEYEPMDIILDNVYFVE